jgi:hypothetical protein
MRHNLPPFVFVDVNVNSGKLWRFSILATFFDADSPNDRNTFNLIRTVTSGRNVVSGALGIGKE